MALIVRYILEFKLKKLLLIVLLLAQPIYADSIKSLTINNLDITVTAEYKVEVYKGMKHIFSFDCRSYTMCEIFTTTKQDLEYKMLDGMFYESVDLQHLAIENIEEVVGYNTNFYGGTIRFFITTTTPSAPIGSATMYTINTKTGSVAVNAKEWGWYRYGGRWVKLKIPEDTVCLETVPLFGMDIEREIAEFEAELAALLAQEAIEREIAAFEAELAAQQLADNLAAYQAKIDAERALAAKNLAAFEAELAAKLAAALELDKQQAAELAAKLAAELAIFEAYHSCKARLNLSDANIAKFKAAIAAGNLYNVGPQVANGTDFSPRRWDSFFSCQEPTGS